MNTGEKNSRGREIYRGPKDGKYVLGTTGKKIYVTTMGGATTEDTGKKNLKGRPILKGRQGGLYVVSETGKKVYTIKTNPANVLSNELMTCPTRGLMQKSSTCWFNAALNGMILSSITWSIILKEVKKLSVREFRELHNKDVRSSCPRELSKKFILAYGIQVHSFSSQDTRKNESLDIVKRTFTPGRLPNSVAEGKRGYKSSHAIDQILWRLFPDDPVIDVPPALTISSRINVKDGRSVPFVLFRHTSEQPHDIPPVVETLDETRFRLSHFVYVIRLGLDGYHAVVGYMCKDKKFIYDSNKRSAKEIDWSRKENLNKMIAYSNGKSFHQLSYVLYMNDSI